MAFDTNLESAFTCEGTGDVHTQTVGETLTGLAALK
jgi:hypothetical protein